MMHKVSKCECGYTLNYAITPFMTIEQRVCPKCGKIHYVDETPIDWQKAFKEQSK